MKRFSYLLLALLFILPSVGVKAQTSASMGLNGVVESYEIDGGDCIGEYAEFNPANKRLKSFQLYCTSEDGGWSGEFGEWLSFNVKGNRPTALNRVLEFGGVCYRWTKLYFNFSYKYSGNKVISQTVKVTVKDNLNPNCLVDLHRIVTHVEKNYTITYKYTKNDKFGNWIERRATCKGESWTETREIVYNKEWLDKQTAIAEKKKIQSFEESDNLYGLSNYLQTYLQPESKTYGRTVWNKLVLSPSITQSTDSAHKYYADAMITSETKQKLSEAWSTYTLSQLKAKNDYNGLYQFSQDSLTTHAAADSARAYWNEQKWASVSGSNATYAQIAAVATHPFAYKDKANNAWNRVQQLYFTHEVMRRTDFREINADLIKTIGGRRVFENALLCGRVAARRDSLRNAEIADYLTQSKQAQSEQNYEGAVSAAQHVLGISPSNEEAIALSADNGYAFLKRLKKQHAITDNDYATYVRQNPRGKYTSDVQDERALVLAKQAHSEKNVKAFANIIRLPMSQDVLKKVNSYDKRTLTRSIRGNFLHLGVEGMAGYAFGPQLAEYGGGAYVRFGWKTAPINVVTGFDYVVHHATYVGDKHFDELNPIYRGAIDYKTMEVPLQLRWNVTHGIGVFYLAAGAQYNLNRNGKLIFHEPIPDTESKSLKDSQLLKKSNFVGYYSIGVETAGVVGFELYVKHDLTDRFDKNYVRSTYCDENRSLQLLEKSRKAQIDGKNWTVGLKMRIFY